MRLALPLVLTLLATPALLAQEVDGILLDGPARRPVSRAAVALHDSAGVEVARVVTRGDGRFRLRAAHAGRYRVRAELAGREVASGWLWLEAGFPVPIELLAAGPAPARADSAVQLEPLAAVAVQRRRRLDNAGFYDRQRSGTGVFLTGEQFEARNGARTIDRIVGLRRIYARPVGGSGWFLYQYGSAAGTGRRCTVALWIDGVQVPAIALNGIQARDVEAIEVYDGDEVPLQFAMLTRMPGAPPCGAVVIWLKAPITG